MNQKILTWFLLLNKRLYKKPLFIVILCLVPVLMLGLKLCSSDKNGILSIALYKENPLIKDELFLKIANQLINEDSMLNFLQFESLEKANEQLLAGKLDAIWIFPENLSEEIQKSAQAQNIKSCIRIIEKEDTTICALAREILCAKLYPIFSYQAYKVYVNKEMQFPYPTEQDFNRAYQRYSSEIKLFNTQDIKSTSQEDFFKTPLRGILAIWLILCGIAASLFWMEDKEKGTFVWAPPSLQALIGLALHTVVILNALIVMIFALVLCKIFASPSKELFSLFLFAIDSILFCNLVQILCKKTTILAALSPAIIIAMLALCPIFVNLKNLHFIQYLLPPFYYLHNSCSLEFLVPSLIYTGILLALTLCFFFKKKSFQF